MIELMMMMFNWQVIRYFEKIDADMAGVWQSMYMILYQLNS